MTKAVVFFDGYCNLCNASVRFIIRNDPNGVFCFSALSSGYARSKLKNIDQTKSSTGSIILFENDDVFEKSTAVLRISRKLKGARPLFYVFIIFPKPIRDFFYDLVAKNRYKVFGRTDSCSIPDPEHQSRFLN